MMKVLRSLDHQGIWLIGASCLFLGLIAGTVGWRDAHTPRLDPITLRATGRAVPGEVVILLDVTDPLTLEERGSLTEWLREFELTTLRPNEHVSLWVLHSGQAGGLERRFCRYYPGRETDALLHNPARSGAVCDSLFSTPLRAAVTDAAAAAPSPCSPIFEAIVELSQQPEMADGSTRKRLIVASDLWENTPRLSFYASVPNFVAFQRSLLFTAARANLHRATVDVLYLPRKSASASLDQSLSAFWREYFAACGAGRVRLERM